MDTLLQDIRYALRILRMAPGFTSVSVLTLALGIVGTTLVFTAYNATMWQPLPVTEPERLTILDRQFRKGGESSQFTMSDYRWIGEHNLVFSGVAAEGQYDTVLAQFPDLQSGKFDEPRQALVKLVSDNYFTVLGVGANPGRVFSPADLMSHGPVAVLSYPSWHRRFRNNYSVLGQTILIYGAAVTIVGIAPPDFVGSGNPPLPPDVWVPLWAESLIEPQRAVRSETDPWLRIVGRLKPGTTVAQAEDQLTILEQQDEKERGVEQVTASVVAGPAFYFIEPGDPQFRILAALLLVSFSIVLLVACANMANFFMARATSRRREMAVRGALGASRGRLLRQLITEGVLLGLAGGAVAVVASKWICDLVWLEVEQRIIARFTDLYVFTFRFTPSPRVLAATCLCFSSGGRVVQPGRGGPVIASRPQSGFERGRAAGEDRAAFPSEHARLSDRRPSDAQRGTTRQCGGACAWNDSGAIRPSRDSTCITFSTWSLPGSTARDTIPLARHRCANNCTHEWGLCRVSVEWRSPATFLCSALAKRTYPSPAAPRTRHSTTTSRPGSSRRSGFRWSAAAISLIVILRRDRQ